MLEIAAHPVFIVPRWGGAGRGVMNLLMAATPLAMQMCKPALPAMPALVLRMACDRHVRAGLLHRAPDQASAGTCQVMGVGVLLNGRASPWPVGWDLHQFLVALFLLGVGPFAGATSLLNAVLPTFHSFHSIIPFHSIPSIVHSIPSNPFHSLKISWYSGSKHRPSATSWETPTRTRGCPPTHQPVLPGVHQQGRYRPARRSSDRLRTGVGDEANPVAPRCGRAPADRR